MRSWMTALLVVMLFPGCTSTRLMRGTIEQAGTLTELQYQQVLNNLAMFCANPAAMPWHVNLRDGSAQIADVGSASYIGDWHRAFVSHPTLFGSRTVVEQWGMSPVTDDTELKLLRIAYRRAVGFGETLKEGDFANDLAHELKKQSPDLNEFLDQSDRLFQEEKSLHRYRLFMELLAGKASVEQFADLVFPKGTRKRYNKYELITLYENFLDETITVTDEKIIKSWEKIKSMDPYDVGQFRDENESTQIYPEIKHDSGGFTLDSDGVTPLKRVTNFAAEIRRQVKDVQKDLLEIGPGWYRVGGKKDVPKDACYVGKYRDCYVWVCPDGLEELTKFTLKILNFASLIKEAGVLTVPGPRFTPASGFPSL